MDPFNKVVLFLKSHFCVHCFICWFCFLTYFNGSLFYTLDRFHHQKPGRTQGMRVCQPLENLRASADPSKEGILLENSAENVRGSALKLCLQMAQKCRLAG